ncbi:hypothetical protein [Gaopeijia maritima]|uniref:DUF4145 domain-containing protein n=1 Tax=Gaopeijia maritima TaxID=3119007 RepID=A0ABU9EBA3_9BACT
MDDVIGAKFDSLEAQGHALLQAIPKSSYRDGSDEYYAPEAKTHEYAAWLASVGNLLKTVALPGSHYPAQVDVLLAHEHMSNGVVTHVVKQLLGILAAAHQDWKQGLLRKIEFIVAAETFDDFLDQADEYFASKKKKEAAVLASAVLEDAVKKVCVKAGVEPAGQTLDPLIDQLVKTGALTPVKAKRWKSFAGVRNKALHAEWDSFDLDDVKALLGGLREIVTDHL